MTLHGRAKGDDIDIHDGQECAARGCYRDDLSARGKPIGVVVSAPPRADGTVAVVPYPLYGVVLDDYPHIGMPDDYPEAPPVDACPAAVADDDAPGPCECGRHDDDADPGAAAVDAAFATYHEALRLDDFTVQLKGAIESLPGVYRVTIGPPRDAPGYGPAPMPAAQPDPPVFMSTDSAVRKLMPVATGCYAYFPDALLCVSWVSRVGADKHCNGFLGWDKSKSPDEPDAGARHALDYFRGVAPDAGLEPLGQLGHLASKAWRALAELQRACDAERAVYAARTGGAP